MLQIKLEPPPLRIHSHEIQRLPSGYRNTTVSFVERLQRKYLSADPAMNHQPPVDRTLGIKQGQAHSVWKCIKDYGCNVCLCNVSMPIAAVSCILICCENFHVLMAPNFKNLCAGLHLMGARRRIQSEVLARMLKLNGSSSKKGNY